jgi:choline dehydrogenase-like flavoprotein
VSHGPFSSKPVVRYTLNDPDMERFRQGMYLLGKMHFAAGARAIIPGISGLPFQLEAKDVELLRDGPTDPRKYIAILSHLFGGCVMGADPTRSVVDALGRVHGYEGLVVADASVMPSIIRGHTHAPVVVIGEKAADLIAAGAAVR